MSDLDGVKSVLITEAELSAAISGMGKILTEDYRGKKLLLVSVLKGAFIFMADLIREIQLPCEVDFLCVSSYKDGVASSGRVDFIKDITRDLSGYDVLIVEDILDTGLTLSEVVRHLSGKGARSVRICTLLDKPSGRRAEVFADYILFTVPDEFVIGYGLDCAELYRNLPYIGIYDKE